MNEPVFHAIMLTAVVCGAAVGAIVGAQDWRVMLYGAIAATNFALCALNIGIAIKRCEK